MIVALSVAFMFMTALFPFADFVFPALAGILLICPVFEIGEKQSFVIFAAAGVLSLILPIDKSSVIYYILFLGHYPIVKSYIERIKRIPLKWAVKIVFFNICAVLALIISVYVLKFNIGNLKYGLIITVLIFNIAFILYDIALTNIVYVYKAKISKMIKRH